MQEVFEKIISDLKKQENKYKGMNLDYAEGLRDGYVASAGIVRQAAAEYNNGWIPVEERLPETGKYILLSFSNFSLPDIGRYEEDEEGGAFYPGDDDASYVSHGLFVNAWQPLPEPYRPEGE